MKYLSNLLLIFLLGVPVDHRTPETTGPPAVEIPQKDPVVRRYASRYSISYRVADKVLQYARKYKIPENIAFSLVKHESRFDTLAHNKASSATGLTQILVSTARKYDRNITRTDLLDIDTNLDLGFRYLSDMHRRYPTDWWRTLVAYGPGPGVADTLEYGFHVYPDGILQKAQ